MDSILDYSKLESGKFIFVEREYDVVECLEDMAYGKIINIQSKPIDFSIEAKTDIPKYLIGDELRVREIFHNIIGNSIKFTDKGSIKVELSFERQDDMVKVDFSVADTGVGMTPAQIDEIFKEYTSLANENSIKGTGLGLAITKELIARMGGHIYAESDGVSGTRFYGDFYQKCNTFENSPRQIFNRRTIAIQKRGLNPTYFTPECIYPAAKFLIADDMKINLEIMKQLISPWKCSVTTVSDGLSAIEACQKNKFDLIFLDQLMAPMNGLETCYELKNITDAPIILVTADEIDNIQAVMERYGFSDYLTKPVHGYHIKRIIDKFMPANLAKNATQEEILRGDYEHTRMYKNTLETFVKEMQPIILNLPNYRVNDPEQFTVKVHGINGVCKQIDRKELAEQALIMEMAAESDTWAYVDEHMDDFLSLICDVVEEVTSELTQINASLEEH